MNRPKRGRAPIKKPRNKKFNTQERGSKQSSTPQHERGRNKGKKSSKGMDQKRNWDLEMPQLNHPASVNIYIVL